MPASAGSNAWTRNPSHSVALVSAPSITGTARAGVACTPITSAKAKIPSNTFRSITCLLECRGVTPRAIVTVLPGPLARPDHHHRPQQDAEVGGQTHLPDVEQVVLHLAPHILDRFVVLGPHLGQTRSPG